MFLCSCWQSFYIFLEKLGFWIDNIHCYAKKKKRDGQDAKDGDLTVLHSEAEQTKQDENKSELKPQIIMLCTKYDKPDDPVGKLLFYL